MAAYNLQGDEGFPRSLKQLAQRVTMSPIIDAGVSRGTTSGGLARLDWSIPTGVDGGQFSKLGGQRRLAWTAALKKNP